MKNKSNKINFSILRDVLICLLIGGAFIFVMQNPVKKIKPLEKIELSQIIPGNFGYWRSLTYDTAEYKDNWKSINELLVRTYYLIDKTNVDLILEYSSDLRKNFSFHFPENCHRASGNKVDFLKIFTVDLGNNKIFKGKYLYIKGVKGTQVARDHLVVYWLVIDQKTFHQTFFIKFDQFLSGILNNSKKGVLVRIDYIDGLKYHAKNIAQGEKIIQNFIKDLYESLDSKQRQIIFGNDYL